MNFSSIAKIAVLGFMELRKTSVCLSAVTVELLLIVQGKRDETLLKMFPAQEIAGLLNFLCYTLS